MDFPMGKRKYDASCSPNMREEMVRTLPPEVYGWQRSSAGVENTACLTGSLLSPAGLVSMVSEGHALI